MKTVNLTEEEHAELLKLRAAKTTKASATSHQDVVRAAGTSEGVAKSWQKRRTEAWDATGFAGEMSSKAHSGTASHLDAAGAHEKAAAIHNEIASLHEPGSRKFELHDSNARAHEKAAEQHQYEDVQSKPAKASDATNTEVIHCRAHASAAGSVLAADAAWSPGESVEFMWMPAGRHTICAGFRNGSIELTVNCDENTAANVQASLDQWRTERPKQEPFGCIEHREHEASVRVSAQQAFSFKSDGVYIAAEPTMLGAQNVNGKVHRSWSPSFTTDADYSQAKTVKTSSGSCMVFPEGVRGSRSNPAQITGVDFCVGTLTNKPAFHSMSPVKASETVRATWSDAARKAAAESRKNHGLDGAKFENSPDYFKKWAGHHGDMVEHHEEEIRLGPTDKREAEGHEEAREMHAQAEHHYLQAAKHLASGNKERASLHLSRAERYSVDAGDKSEVESVHAHCANTLKQDVPDATPAEVACYEKCLHEGGSHDVAVIEIRKQRNPAAKASLEDIYDKVTAGWSPQARAAAAAARKNHAGLSPEHKKAAEAVAESSDHKNADDFYHSSNEADVWQAAGIPAHLHAEALDHATAHFEKINSSEVKSLDTILARQASVLEQANAIATEHGVARTTLDDVYDKVTATGTSEGVRKSWESRKAKVGDRVKVTDGSGIDSGKEGVVVHRSEVKTDGRGIPTNVSGAYKPIDHSKEHVIKRDDGKLMTMPHNRVMVHSDSAHATDATPQGILDSIYARAETVTAGGTSEGSRKGWLVRMHKDPAGKGMWTSLHIEHATSREDAEKQAAEKGKGTDHPYVGQAIRKKPTQAELIEIATGHPAASDKSAALQSIYASAGETR